jgi:hypothetical protein
MQQPHKDADQVFNEISALVAMDFRTKKPLSSLEEVIDKSLSLSSSRYKGGFIGRKHEGREEFYRFFHTGLETYKKCYHQIIDLQEMQRDSLRHDHDYDAKVIATDAHWNRAISFIESLMCYTGIFAKLEHYPPEDCAASYPYDDQMVEHIIYNGVGVTLGPDFEDGPLDADTPVEDGEDYVVWIFSDTEEVNNIIKGAFISLMECNL